MSDIFDMTPGKWDWLRYTPYRIWQKIKNFYYERKYTVQRIFKGYADVDIFELYSTTARTILPRLVEFKKNHHGYPSIFSDYEDGSAWESKEKYDAMIKDGTILGGGDDAWVAILDKMIFSFSYIIVEDMSPKGKFEKNIVKDFKEKYGDVWAETEENIKGNSYHLFVNENKNLKDDDIAAVHIPEDNFDDNTIKEEEAKGMTYKGFKTRNFHHNDKLATELHEKCDEGLALFGKYFRNLWD